MCCGRCDNCKQVAEVKRLIVTMKGVCDDTDKDYQQAKRDYPCTRKVHVIEIRRVVHITADDRQSAFDDARNVIAESNGRESGWDLKELKR